MPGTRAGTGQPISLKCSQCKKQRDLSGTARSGKLLRTGRTRPYHPRGAHGRMTTTAHECECKMCGTIGWYAHADAARLALRL